MKKQAAATFALVLVGAVNTADAAPTSGADLVSTVSANPSAAPYTTARYSVRVANSGNTDAQSTVLTIDLPRTSTSPQVHVMGTLGARDSRCSVSGTRLTCNLGRLRKGRNTTVWFDAAFAYSTAPLVVAANATSSTNELVPSNNGVNFTPTQAHPSNVAQAGDTVAVDLCTGTSLTSFWECELYPSSIQSHALEFQSGGVFVVSVPAGTGYTGTWWQPDATRLEMRYFDGTTQMASFSGRSVSATCFEGVVNHGSGYVSPYSVCR